MAVLFCNGKSCTWTGDFKLKRDPAVPYFSLIYNVTTYRLLDIYNAIIEWGTG